jgi:hypothetical protein
MLLNEPLSGLHVEEAPFPRSRPEAYLFESQPIALLQAIRAQCRILVWVIVDNCSFSVTSPYVGPFG